MEATHAHPTCTQCGENPGDYVALNDFRSMMKLVRLQTTIPISGECAAGKGPSVTWGSTRMKC